MTLDKQRLNTALSTIHSDERGYFASGEFVDLTGDVYVKIFERRDLNKLNTYLGFIVQDLWNIETIAFRLKWQQNLLAQNQLNDAYWMSFVRCDVDLFHIEFRSIFDYIAKIVCSVSDSPGQVKAKSFEKMRNWVTEPRNAKKLGDDLVKLVQSCEWFSALKDTRDSIVHNGANTLIFQEKDKILFQVHQGIKRKVVVPEVMFNQNVVDFELYAGLHTGYLLAYLEEVAKVVYNRINIKKSSKGNTKSYHSGLHVINDWIKQVCLLST